MTVWLFEHTIDYEGVLTLEIFSTAQKACEYADYYIKTSDWPKDGEGGWQNVYEYSYRDQTLKITPYEVDKCA